KYITSYYSCLQLLNGIPFNSLCGSFFNHISLFFDCFLHATGMIHLFYISNSKLPHFYYLKIVLLIGIKVSNPSPSNLTISISILLNLDRKSTRLNSSHVSISYAVFCLKKKKTIIKTK